jgi:hypothetical protein
MDVMDSIRKIFEVLQRASKPTLQFVVPSYYKLLSAFSESTGDCLVIKTFKKQLKEYVDSHFYTSIKAYHWIACFLDPSFRELRCVPEGTTAKDRAFRLHLLADVDKWVLSEMEVISGSAQTPAVDLEEPPTKSANTSDDIFSDFRSIASTSSASAPSLSPESHKLTEELRRYKTYQASAVVYDKQDPLQFWKAVEGEFPVLSVLARQVLCICATSAQSERDFSSVGLTITQLRSRLSAEKVEAIQIIRSAQTAGIVTNEFALAD